MLIMTAPAIHPTALDVETLLADCRLRFGRRSGPGGQHRNKVETAVVITHLPSGQSGSASERRSQAENRKTALARLRTNLALAVRCPIREAPSKLWQSRCRGGRIQVNPAHDDFPALLAEALDVLAAHDMNLRTAAEWLRCTPTQLTRFLKLEERALAQVNQRRKDLGLGPLR
jgi:hypothetical protein